MKFQDSSFNGLKVTVGTKSVTHPSTQPRSKSNMPHQLFQSLGHKKWRHHFSHYKYGDFSRHSKASNSTVCGLIWPNV